MDRIASKDKCTGCAVCSYVCPKSCIKMIEQGFDGLLPVLDTNDCINCGRCTSVCPVKTPIKKQSQIEVFASWHSNVDMRRKCASSGTVSAMYHEALVQGWHIVGAVSVNALDVEMTLCNNSNSIQDFSSSKYIFSNCEKLYPQLKRTLDDGRKVLFIGLPCQVAAIHNLFKNKREQMILVDLVCHGTNAKKFLQQHVARIESLTKSQVNKVIFREGKDFLIKMLDKNGNVIYSESSWYKDMYQYGYHRGLFYRKNCYQCNYASSDRISDITLKDYWGLGECGPIDYPKERVSAVLVNTDRGLSFFNKCIENGYVIAFKRPLEEPVKGDVRLQYPTLIKSEKIMFDTLMNSNGHDFESAMMVIARKNQRKDVWNKKIMRTRMRFYMLRSKIYHLIVDKLK